ncbi:MAG: ABC transporter permease [Paludibaculum sp.]
MISFAVSQNRFGGPSSAIGQSILVDNVPFTVIGVTPPEFFGVDPASSPDLYLPLRTNILVDGDRAARMFPDENFYWIEMMGRLRPGVSMAQAQAVLAPRFHQWVAATATTDGERAKLPALLLNPGAGRPGQFAPPVFQASVCAAGDGGTDSGNRVREYRQSAAGEGSCATARNGGPAKLGRGTIPNRTAVAYRECDAGVARGSTWGPVCDLGRAMR